MNPENTEFVRLPVEQGAAKGPWVTVWFLGKNVNSRISSTAAVVEFGENFNSPPMPTIIGMVLATAVETRAAAAMVRVLNNMMMDMY